MADSLKYSMTVPIEGPNVIKPTKKKHYMFQNQQNLILNIVRIIRENEIKCS
jgi:hypothetical protein